MSKFSITGTTLQHVSRMRGQLREEDARECWASAHLLPDAALMVSFTRSDKCWTALLGGKPVACFGVAPVSWLGRKGVPWMLGTDDFKKLGVKAARVSRKYVRQMLEGFDVLENWVDVRNLVSIKWLKWCGFTIEAPIPYGPEGLPFHRFWMEKKGAAVCAHPQS